jgi:uncharacterized repeat protein (TIGR01451 family)
MRKRTQVMLSVLAAGAAMLLVGITYGGGSAPEAEAQVADGCTGVFNFSGAAIDFTVPGGIEQVELDVFGAAGGDATGSAQNVSEGGFGAGLQNAILPVAPGDELTVIVGGEGGPAESLQGINAGGTGGFGYAGTPEGGQSGGTGGTAEDFHGGGGGGGASGVLLNGTLVVAAGGGGGGSHGGAGGDGGQVGENGMKAPSGTGVAAAFGLGASQTAGGAGGVGSFGGLDGAAGGSGVGGAGGGAVATSGGESSPGGDAGGGGGGGTFGGGGAGGSAASSPGGGAGGGGGSSTTTIGPIDPGVRDGDGRVDITLSDEDCPGDLQIEKSVSDRRPDVDDRITYTLEVTNNGPVDPDTGVVVTDPLPAEVEYVSDDCERGTTNGNDPAPWTWEIGELGDDETVTCEITVDVIDSGTDIPNTATVRGNNFDRNPDNNEDTVDITIPPLDYDLEIVKDVAPTQVLVGDQVTYTMSVINLGPDRSQPGGVADLLPPQVEYVSDTCGGRLAPANPSDLPFTLPNGMPFTLPAGQYWVVRVPALPPLETLLCQLTVRVLQAGTDITNYAGILTHEVEGGLMFRNNLDDAKISARTPDLPPGTPTADLAIDKSGPARVDQGARIAWTIRVTNNGPAASSGSTVVDQIPEAVRRPRTSTPGCTVADHRLECRVGALAVGESTEISVSGRAPFRVGCRGNPAGVSGNETDPNATNNNDVARTCTRGPRLRLTKSTRRNVVRPGEVFAYRIVVRNVGGGPARSVRVCDMASPDLRIVRAPGAEQVGPRRACWDVRLLRAGRRRAFAVIARVVAGADPGVKPNTATATASNVRRRLRSRARVRVRPPTDVCPAVNATASC